jgi:hypothetical protein
MRKIKIDGIEEDEWGARYGGQREDNGNFWTR